MMLRENQRDTPRFSYLDARHKSFFLYREATIFTEETVLSEDGIQLSVYEVGDPNKPTAVLVNPLGISCLFMVNLARSLAREYHVITWETRGLPDYVAVKTDSTDQWSLESHCKDLANILERKRCHADAIITYCSGANIAVYGLTSGIIKTKTLCLVSPSLEMGDAGMKTDYQRTVLPLWLKITQEGLRLAALVRVLLRHAEKPFDSSTDYELSIINNLPFQSNEHIYRYAQLHAPCLQLDCVSLLRQITVPTMVIHSEDDDMIHADTAKAVAAALPNSQLSWINDGGHFAVYKSQNLRNKILEFLFASQVHFIGHGVP